MMNAPENKRPVTLEDLIQLKRAERPSPEFWSKFEAELRAKQLAAIVEKKPWWQTVSFAGVMRYRVPLGATALLAISFVSIREYRGATPSLRLAQLDPIAAAPASGVASSSVAQVTAVVSTPAPVETSTNTLDSRTVPASMTVAVSSVGLSADQTGYAGGSMEPTTVANALGESAPAAQWLLALDRAGNSELSLTARSIADNLAAAKEAHPELTNRFFGISGFEKRSMPASRQMVDPLSQMRSPSELHRERLLASAIPASTANVGRNSERLVRRMSEQRLTEEAISRIDAKGDRFLVKF
jgi:hypothetical protein